MHNRRVLLMFSGVVLAAMAFMCWAAAGWAEEGQKASDKDIVARIGSRTITQAEFEQGLRIAAATRARMANRMGKTAPAFFTEEERKQVLDGMIEAEVIGILAEEAKVEVPDSAVQEKLQSFKSRFPSVEEYNSGLAKEGMTEAELTNRFREQLRIPMFMQQKTKDITATEQEISAEYEQLKSQGLLDTVDVAHILVKVQGTDESAWEDAKKRIDAARKRIVDGEDFATVAKEVSEDARSAKNGGLFPNMPRGGMPPDFAKVAFSIPVGELSEPFRAEDGWHILKVSAKGQISLQDASQRIAQEITAKKRRAEVKRLVDEAKAKIKIEVNLPPASATGIAPSGTTPSASDTSSAQPPAAGATTNAEPKPEEKQPGNTGSDVPLPDETS